MSHAFGCWTCLHSATLATHGTTHPPDNQLLKDLLDHYHSLVLTISFLICATSILT